MQVARREEVRRTRDRLSLVLRSPHLSPTFPRNRRIPIRDVGSVDFVLRARHLDRPHESSSLPVNTDVLLHRLGTQPAQIFLLERSMARGARQRALDRPSLMIHSRVPKQDLALARQAPVHIRPDRVFDPSPRHPVHLQLQRREPGE